MDELAVALSRRVRTRRSTPPVASQVGAVLTDLRDVAATLRAATACAQVMDDPRVRPLLEIRRELLVVVRVFAPFAAGGAGTGFGPGRRPRHLRAASLLPPPPGALALERLLRVLVHRGRVAFDRGLSLAATARAAAEDLRAAAEVLHRLTPRPEPSAIAQLAALAADLRRIGSDRAANESDESQQSHGLHEIHGIQEIQETPRIQ